MSLGLVGRKVGMTRVFTDDGDSIPVTVVDVSNNRVTQIKSVENDGYCAVQVAYGKRRASHGNSVSHNKPGSISMAQDPGRVFPGKKMPGHLGAANRTVQNLEIVRIDAERQLLLIRGAVPGAKGGDIAVYPAVKPRKRAAAAKPAKAAK